MAMRGPFGLDGVWFGVRGSDTTFNSGPGMVNDQYGDTIRIQKANPSDPDFTFETNGYRIYARNLIYIGPGVTVTDRGKDAIFLSDQGGIATLVGTMGNGKAGGEPGAADQLALPGTAPGFSIGGGGGNGGATVANGPYGGSGKAGGATSSSTHKNVYFSSMVGYLGHGAFAGSLVAMNGGGGGGGGQDNLVGTDYAQGGGGGGGGGVILLAAPTIINDGIIDVSGGHGANAESIGSAGGGGGGGGGGGAILLFCGNQSGSGTMLARGGDGGDGATVSTSKRGQAGKGGSIWRWSPDDGHLQRFTDLDGTDGVDGS